MSDSLEKPMSEFPTLRCLKHGRGPSEQQGLCCFNVNSSYNIQRVYTFCPKNLKIRHDEIRNFLCLWKG